ncbi:Tellurite resistance protein TerB [Catalinimonas alkaloidigena]|uniref:Tellurite resistance protein TerB n=2 Tax=Catalinimonas alkaloidigena TaxID=1075417 RepID=A0A1G9EI23_9BACT|nr:Tellurite resistance protein TerB [Catalinimonas alkaloidigena]
MIDTHKKTLLSGYSEREKSAYLGAIATIAMADSRVTPEEIQFLHTLSDAANLPSTEADRVVAVAQSPNSLNLKQCLDVLKASELKYAFLTDVIAFAKADGQFTKEEDESIRQMASYLALTEAQYRALVEYADQPAAATASPEANSLAASGFGDRFEQLGIPKSAMKALLLVAAPMVLREIFKDKKQPIATQSHGTAPAAEPTSTGGGLLDQLLGGFGGGRSTHNTAGGLGSMASVLSGNRGYRSTRGLLESVIGAVAAGPYQHDDRRR